MAKKGISNCLLYKAVDIWLDLRTLTMPSSTSCITDYQTIIQDNGKRVTELFFQTPNHDLYHGIWTC